LQEAGLPPLFLLFGPPLSAGKCCIVNRSVAISNALLRDYSSKGEIVLHVATSKDLLSINIFNNYLSKTRG
jgi:hypothetical protein